MQFLKNHPFAVEAFFDQSVVLTFALPKAQLAGLIPACLELDTFEDKWAFLAVALVQTKDLRPKGFPKFMGHDFFLIGYRIFVRYTNRAGKRLRGLYILKSETDREKMEYLGNIFTHYNYTTTDIARQTAGDKTTITSAKSGFEVVLHHPGPEVSLPEQSPFPDWKSARRFAGPLPHTFTYNAQNNTVLIIEGVRQFWTPEPVHVEHYDFAWLRELHLDNAVLASAFEVKNIPYHWKKGTIEPWHQPANPDKGY